MNNRNSNYLLTAVVVIVGFGAAWLWAQAPVLPIPLEKQGVHTSSIEQHYYGVKAVFDITEESATGDRWLRIAISHFAADPNARYVFERPYSATLYANGQPILTFPPSSEGILIAEARLSAILNYSNFELKAWSRNGTVVFDAAADNLFVF
jgi:hypothetical protein